MDAARKIKCLVWDLDETIWHGILSEGTCIKLKDGVEKILKELDKRGILLSIASKNEYKSTMEQLKKFNIAHFFLYPQISWQPKSISIQTIAHCLNIHPDSIAFIDDQEYERNEVAFSIKEVMCLKAEDTDKILEMPEFQPEYITVDARMRRKMYQDDILRMNSEKKYESQQDFLASLGMILSLSHATESDLQRVEELTKRTHQLNSTGYTYSYEELRQFIYSEDYLLYVAELTDCYGSYGKIGVILISMSKKVWTIKLLLVSCRVISRGVGTTILSYILNMAKNRGADIYADFLPTDRNRMMYVTYKFTGFEEYGKSNEITLLKHKLKHIPTVPTYMKLHILS